MHLLRSLLVVLALSAAHTARVDAQSLDALPADGIVPAGAMVGEAGGPSPATVLPASLTPSAPQPAAPADAPGWDAGAAARPRWLTWGIVGAGLGAVTFALLGQLGSPDEPNPVLRDAAFGAAAGFVILGGSVAVYDLVCAPGSTSQRAGLC
jgi:hypothetical protein